MPRHLISDAHEWMNEIPTVPYYYLANPQVSIHTQITSTLEQLLVVERSNGTQCLQDLCSMTNPLFILEYTAKGTGLEESAGKEDPVELDSSPTL